MKIIHISINTILIIENLVYRTLNKLLHTLDHLFLVSTFFYIKLIKAVIFIFFLNIAIVLHQVNMILLGYLLTDNKKHKCSVISIYLEIKKHFR